MVATRAEVYAALDSERDYQQIRWDGHFHPPESYCLFMEDYLAQARSQASRTDFSDPMALREYLATIRKVTALGVACMEAFGALKRFTPPAENRGYYEGRPEETESTAPGAQTIVDTALVEDVHLG